MFPFSCQGTWGYNFCVICDMLNFELFLLNLFWPFYVGKWSPMDQGMEILGLINSEYLVRRLFHNSWGTLEECDTLNVNSLLRDSQRIFDLKMLT